MTTALGTGKSNVFPSSSSPACKRLNILLVGISFLLSAATSSDGRDKTISMSAITVTIGGVDITVTNTYEGRVYGVEYDNHLPFSSSSTDEFVAAASASSWSQSPTENWSSVFYRIHDLSGRFLSIAVTEPQSYQGRLATTNQTLELRGFATPGADIECCVNGVWTGTVSESRGAWTIADIPLQIGRNDIIVAAHVGGSSQSNIVHVYRNRYVPFTAPLLIDPFAVPVGSPTSVTFTVGVPTTGIDVAEADLISVDEQDVMTGDEAAGDGVYSCIATVDVAHTSRLCFRARATLSDMNSGCSETRELTLYEPLTQAEIVAEANHASEASQHTDTQAELVAWLESQPGVSELERTDIEVSWLSPNGLPHVVLFPPEEELPAESTKSAKARSCCSGSSMAPPFCGANVVGNNRVLVWEPFNWSGLQYDAVVDQYANDPHDFDPLRVPNSAADPASVKRWDNYGIVYVNTHGSPNVLMTGTLVTTNNTPANKRYQRYWLSNPPLLVPGGIDGHTNKEWWCATPAFLQRYCNGFPNSFVFLGACRSRPGGLPSLMMQNGAGATISYGRTVYSDANSGFASSLTQALLQGNTVFHSYDASLHSHGFLSCGVPMCDPACSDLVILRNTFAIFPEDTPETPPLSVSFDATTSFPEASSYSWRSSSGHTESGATATMTFQEEGRHTVSLEVHKDDRIHKATRAFTLYYVTYFPYEAEWENPREGEDAVHVRFDTLPWSYQGHTNHYFPSTVLGRCTEAD